MRSIISRTGYTGEDGFELFIPPASAERVWNAILEAGARPGIVPVGLGARDTLRLEAGMHLSGQDIDETTTVLEADLGWIVGWKKDDFHRQSRRWSAEERRPHAQARRVRDDRARHRAPRLQSVRRRRRRHRDERHANSVSQEGDRLRVSSDCGERPIGTDFEIDIRGRRTPRASSRRSSTNVPGADTCIQPTADIPKTTNGSSSSGNRGRVGITDYAQKQLGDVVFVELPEVGRAVTQGQAAGTIESVKAVSELYSPASGKVVAVERGRSAQSRRLVNRDPHGTWLFDIELSNPAEVEELLTNDQYAELVK